MIEDMMIEDMMIEEKTIQVSEIFGPVLQGEGALIGRPTVFVRTGGCDFRCAWCDTLYAVLPSFRDEWRRMNASEIIDEVGRLSSGHPILITLSGGNPALQPLDALLDCGRARGCAFALETQGSVAKSWFAKLDHLILSPKPPSSQMPTDWEKLGQCLQAAGMSTRVIFKIVVFDEIDYGFAREVHRRFPAVAMYLQPGNPISALVSAPRETVSLIGKQWSNGSCVDQSDAAPHMSTHVGEEGDGGHDATHDAMDVCARTAAQLTWLLERVARDGWLHVTLLPQMHVLLWGNKRGV